MAFLFLKSLNHSKGQQERKCPTRLLPRRAGDIEKIYADTSFANEELGWKAVSTLDETPSFCLEMASEYW